MAGAALERALPDNRQRECSLVVGLIMPRRRGKPQLVLPREITHCSMVTVEGAAAMIHALEHIELNPSS